jgi:hypothetical protein
MPDYALSILVGALVAAVWRRDRLLWRLLGAVLFAGVGIIIWMLFWERWSMNYWCGY